jgi:predicted dienelactone hydrolase
MTFESQSGTDQSYPVETLYSDWKDEIRDRVVPAKMYFPVGAKRKCPVVFFSHGLGGTMEGGEMWGRHWAGNGYVSVHPQHVGSDDKILRGTPEQLNNVASHLNKENWIARIMDISFILDQLTRQNILPVPIDMARVGMSGHSFGSATTLGICGQKISYGESGEMISFADKRIKAGIAFSPSVTVRDEPKAAFGSIKVPFLNITGRKDDSPVTTTKAADRRIPFDNMKGKGKYLVVFEHADHWVFTGTKRFRAAGAHDAVIHGHIQEITTAFWDAHLRGDSDAERWLSAGSAASAMGTDGILIGK